MRSEVSKIIGSTTVVIETFVAEIKQPEKRKNDNVTWNH